MRIVCLLITFWATVCDAQMPVSTAKAAIDTIRLFDPKPDSSVKYASAHSIEMFNNCIMFSRRGYSIMHNKELYQINDQKALFLFLAKHKQQLGNKKLYLLTDSSTSFTSIVSVIDKLQKLNFDNYKVLNMQQYFKAPDPVQITSPHVILSKPKEYDSSYLIITVIHHKIKVKLFSEESFLKNSRSLDSFIIANKAVILPGKIVLQGAKDVPYNEIGPVLKVLQKNDYFKYELHIVDADTDDDLNKLKK